MLLQPSEWPTYSTLYLSLKWHWECYQQAEGISDFGKWLRGHQTHRPKPLALLFLPQTSGLLGIDDNTDSSPLEISIGVRRLQTLPATGIFPQEASANTASWSKHPLFLEHRHQWWSKERMSNCHSNVITKKWPGSTLNISLKGVSDDASLHQPMTQKGPDINNAPRAGSVSKEADSGQAWKLVQNIQYRTCSSLVSGKRALLDMLSKPLQCLDFTRTACIGDSVITRLFQNLNPWSLSVAISPKVALLDKSYVWPRSSDSAPWFPQGKSPQPARPHSLAQLPPCFARIHNQISPPVVSLCHEFLWPAESDG